MSYTILDMRELAQSFEAFFRRLNGFPPYPYQRRLATQPVENLVIDVPTGLGKTAAVLTAWLWQRQVNPEATPRRLVYCLPMRTLVEQTAHVARRLVEKQAEGPTVAVMMGGEDETGWDLYPEKEAILIGTQDMLLSRALNRGYAMSRFRWPVHFALLNNDCLWVNDETQLMGAGLATTSQLAAFRFELETLGPSFTWWMSATLGKASLATVDLTRVFPQGLPVIGLEAEDIREPAIQKRREAVKTLSAAPAACRLPQGLAEFVVKYHKGGSQALVIVNRVLLSASPAHDIRWW